MKTVGNFTHTFEAELAKGYLETQGITAYVKDEFMGQYLIYNNAIGGVRLQVMEEDYEKALKIYKDYKQDVSADANRLTNVSCPKCGSEEVIYRRISTFGWLFSFFFLGAPFLFFHPFYRCENCRHRWK